MIQWCRICLAVSVFSHLNIWAEGVCDVSTLHSLSSEILSSEDRVFTSPDRSQYLAFSRHMTPSDMQMLENFVLQSDYYAETNFPAEITSSWVDMVKNIVQNDRDRLEQARANMLRLQAEHERSPFQYVGLEIAEEEREALAQIQQRALRLRETLRSHFSDQLTEQEIEDILLFLLDEELYMTLPGQPLGSLPLRATESDALKDEFLQPGPRCRQVLSLYYNASDGHPSILDFQYTYANSLDIADRQAYDRQKQEMIEQLLIVAGSPEINDVLRARAQEALQVCDHIFNQDRDAELARIMLQDLPEGRGLIFRGYAHRNALTQQFERLCSGGSAPLAPADAGTD